MNKSHIDTCILYSIEQEKQRVSYQVMTDQKSRMTWWPARGFERSPYGGIYEGVGAPVYVLLAKSDV